MAWSSNWPAVRELSSMALSTSNNSALDFFVFASLNSISVRVLTTASGVRRRCAASAINSSDL